MHRKIYLLMLCLITAGGVFAQQQKTQSQKERNRQERKQHLAELIKREEEGSLIFNKQFLLGLKLNTDGWAGMYEHGKYKTLTKTNTWFIEFGERKSHREEKISLSDQLTGFPIGNPFAYGKRNNFYHLDFGLGQQRLLGGKGPKNGVAVSAVYGGGISLGLLKPYYVLALDPNGETFNIKYQDNNSYNDTLFLTSAISSAGLTKGIGETKIVPGLTARLGLRFDYGRYNELLSALEVGITGSFYTQDMPIMIYDKPKKFFANAYVAIEFGGRK